jgi:hypothetical protein
VTPFAWIDGKKSGYDGSAWWGITHTRSTVESPLEITLSGNYDPTAKTGTIKAKVENTSGHSITGSLLFVLTESNISLSAPNGESHFNQAVRDMIPNHVGINVTIPAGGEVDETQNFTVNNTWVDDNCELVAFVQNNTMTADSIFEVYQAAKTMVTSLPATGIVSSPDPRPSTLTLTTPRPVISNGNFTLEYALPKDGTVHLTVYNLLGEKVATLVNAHRETGSHIARWNGRDDTGSAVPAGVYLFQLTVAGSTKITRGIVTR